MSFLLNPHRYVVEGEVEVDFPVVESRSSGRDASATTTHPITMPSSVQVGDFLLVLFAIGGASTASVSSGTGWTLFDHDAFGATSAVFWKIADGSDALTIGTTTSGR